jgi:hypothetical protein
MQYEVEFLTDGCYNEQDTEYFISHWSVINLIGNTIIYEDDETIPANGDKGVAYPSKNTVASTSVKEGRKIVLK